MASTDLITYIESQSYRVEKKFTHKWIINDFCCAKVIGEDVLPSTIFAFNYGTNAQFIGEFSLDGTNCEERQCSLTLRSSTVDNWKLYIKLWVGENWQSMRTFYLNNKNNTNTFYLKDTFGSCLISEHVNTIMCEIFYVFYIDKKVSISSTIKEDDGAASLFETNKKEGDVIVVVEGQELHAHKAILANSSKVFAAMFKCEMEENISNRVEINDMEPEVVKEMLRFIYTGKVSNLNKLDYKLLAASDKYDLAELKSICENELMCKVSIENAAKILIYADLYNVPKLKEHTIKFIHKNRKDVAITEGWRKLSINYSHLLMELYLQTLN